MRKRRLVRVLGLAVLALLVFGSLPAVAETAEVGTSQEAWYSSGPVGTGGPLCVLPCPGLPASPYPEDTLHVGAQFGSETERTYVSLELFSLPFDAELTGGTVRLPVAGSDAGTNAAESAAISACLVTEPFQPAEGESTEEAAEIDCSTSAPLAFADGTFTFDLGPFARAWASGSNNGFALVPAPETADDAASWHVAFHGRDREAEGATPITATVTYEEGESDGFGSMPSGQSGFGNEFGPTGSGDPQRVDGGTAPAPSGGFGTFEDPASPPSVDEPFTADPQEGAFDDDAFADGAGEGFTSAAEDPFGATGAGYAYPLIWLVPLALVGIGGLLGRSLAIDYEVESSDLV